MAKVIEATAVISARAGDMSGLETMAANLMKVSKVGQQVKTALGGAAVDLGKRVTEISSQLAKIDNFRAMSRGLDQASIAMKAAQQNATRMKAALDAVDAPTRKMQSEYARAAAAVDRATQAFKSQGQAVRETRATLEASGIPINTIARQQEQLTRALNTTTRAMERQASAGRTMRGPTRQITAANVPSNGYRVSAPSEGGGTSFIPLGMRGAGALAALYAGKKVHDFIIENHHDFQQAQLRQQGVLGIEASEQATMTAQAEKIGKDTKFTNADIVRAQTDIGGKLPKEMQKPAIIEAITENTKNYALAMQVSMVEGAEAVVGYMKSWGYDLSSPEAAAASSRRAANMLVQQAKTTGAKHHDLLGSTKFGAAPARAGGFSEEMTNAIQAQLIRVGYEGAMAGTFARAVSTKLAVPSKQGMAAIAGMGVEYNQFRKPGSTPATADAFSNMLQLQFGRKLGAKEKALVQAVLDDGDVMGDKGAYTEKISEILNNGFARKTKAGKVDVRQAAALTRVSDQFYNVVSGGVDTQGLFLAIINKGINSAIARYLFGQEHGGRAIGLDGKAIERDFRENLHVPPNRAEVIAEKNQEGAQGEWNKLVGSVQTFGVALGESTDSLRKWTYWGLGAAIDYMTDLVKGKDIKPGVAANMSISKEGAPYRLDTWSSDAVGIYERSRRIDADFRRDQEGARGRAMMDLSSRVEAVVKPDKITAKAEVSGSTTVTVQIEPSGALTGLINGARQQALVPLRGNGAGSVGSSMPEAAAPARGHFGSN